MFIAPTGRVLISMLHILFALPAKWQAVQSGAACYVSGEVMTRSSNAVSDAPSESMDEPAIVV